MVAVAACGASHSGDGPPAELGTEVGPWCGENGSWRLTIDLDAVEPIVYDVEVDDSVLRAIDESCAIRWRSDTEACVYDFEVVCASPDIRRTDYCEMEVVSATRMEGSCTQTVESGGMVQTYEGTGSADFVPPPR